MELLQLDKTGVLIRQYRQVKKRSIRERHLAIRWEQSMTIFGFEMTRCVVNGLPEKLEVELIEMQNLKPAAN